jgi:predicted phosphodiesterase
MIMRYYGFFCMLFFIAAKGYAQTCDDDSTQPEIALVSDTQAPLGIERVFRKINQNALATKKILQDITDRKPRALFILGDVVSVGYKEKSWQMIDSFLLRSRGLGISVTAILGNHDVFMSSVRGETAFNKRFPDQVNTGFYKLVDSIGFVLLNSNFSKLTAAQLQKQQDFYATTMEQLEADSSVKLIIVACHHSPYSNSRTVRSNPRVQERFVPLFQRSEKAKLFISGHAHAFEHFTINGKDFLTIGGGGGIHQPLNKSKRRIRSLSEGYYPEFHYILMKRKNEQLEIISRQLRPDFSGFTNEYQFTTR